MYLDKYGYKKAENYCIQFMNVYKIEKMKFIDIKTIQSTFEIATIKSNLSINKEKKGFI